MPCQELSSLQNIGRKLHDDIKSFDIKQFSSYPNFLEFNRLIMEKINLLNNHLSNLLRYYPNNSENAILIMILGSFKKNLKNLKDLCEIEGTISSNKFFKKSSPLCDPTQKDRINNYLSFFAGSLNTLESYLNKNLHGLRSKL